MQNVLIVGAGTGGSIILDLLQNVDFMKVKAIIDMDENAPGIQRAKKLGVSHGTEWRSWLTDDLHIIFDVTGNSLVFTELLKARPAHTVLVPESVANLLIKLLQENTRSIGRMQTEMRSLMNELKSARSIIRKLEATYTFNVKELENVLSRAMIYMDAGETVIGLEEMDKSLSSREYKAVEQLLSEKSTLASIMEEHEKEILEAALRENKGNKSLTANRLGISLRSLYYKLEKYSLI